jgi:hypothetical protein
MILKGAEVVPYSIMRAPCAPTATPPIFPGNASRSPAAASCLLEIAYHAAIESVAESLQARAHAGTQPLAPSLPHVYAEPRTRSPRCGDAAGRVS